MENGRAVESMVKSSPDIRAAFWRGKRVFITGHTGFKGSWLSLWLKEWDAELYGYSLAPERPSLFRQASLAQHIHGEFNDIRDYKRLARSMARHQPEIVFHLAAQPLVRAAYEDPVGSYATNVQGTVHLLESARHTPSVKAVVVITSDKCYDNQESDRSYQEDDRLGGYDPYSSSKACAELVCQSYRASYFSMPGTLHLATARAGNVIGGGDWAKDRLIPDAMRAFMAEKPLIIRYPNAIRPWQHVLEAVNGYLVLAEAIYETRDYASAWNFGPHADAFCTVQDIVEKIISMWGGNASWFSNPTSTWRESRVLKLDINKALERLNWRPKMSLSDALTITINWYKKQHEKRNMLHETIGQIHSYINA